MRRWTLILLFLFAASVARANPVSLDPSAGIAFMIVALFALIVEAGVVALLLLFSGLSPLAAFIGYFAANLAVFAFLFCPLLSSHALPVILLELLVVGADGAAIKLLAAMERVQGDDFRGLTWRRAFLISCAGNAISYFVGVLASRSPWESHM
jgi:hypothetical protein